VRDLDRRGLAVLSAGHMTADLCQGAVPALLPFFVAQRGYSYGAASALVLAATVASSIIQPIFGHLSDRRALEWLMPAGVLAGGIGIALTGVAPSYAATFAAIVLSGIGVAAYHPEASRFANYASGERQATGMSLFSVGGNVGFALGPIVVTPLVLLLGLPGTLFVVVAPALVAVVLIAELARLRSLRPPGGRPATVAADEPDDWPAFARLGAAVSLRSISYFGLMTFVPLWFVQELDTSKGVANGALAAMLSAGALGTLVGGRLADRHTPRLVFVVSMALATPLTIAFLFAPPVPAILLLAGVGGVTIATFSVTVVIGQRLLPGHVGVASGVTLGLAIGIGGVGASLLGLLADAQGLRAPLEVVAVLPLLTMALAASLPGRREEAAGRNAAVRSSAASAGSPASG